MTNKHLSNSYINISIYTYIYVQSNYYFFSFSLLDYYFFSFLDQKIEKVEWYARCFLSLFLFLTSGRHEMRSFSSSFSFPTFIILMSLLSVSVRLLLHCHSQCSFKQSKRKTKTKQKHIFLQNKKKWAIVFVM